MLGVAICGFYMNSFRLSMSSSPAESPLLLIRCPSCAQRFKVGEDLRGRTVECGACEHRFKIDDSVIVKGRKFYPSENKDPSLTGFSRIPLPSSDVAAGLNPVRYGSIPDPALLEPVSPQRVIAGVIGVSGMVLIALFLILGSSRGGVLDGTSLGSRFMMAGFFSVMGMLSLLYANPRARTKAFLVGLVLSSCLTVIPYFFRGGSDLDNPSLATSPATVDLTLREAEKTESAEDQKIASLRAQIGTGPLVTEIQRLAAEGSKYQAMGIWLRGLSDSRKFLVRDFMFRVAAADPSSHFYPRSGGDYLLVLSGLQCSLDELAKLAAPLGVLENTYPEISVIEIRVSEEIFMEGSMEKLSRKEDPAFYDLNKRELESIDLQRIKRAIQRLAEAEPKVYRTDITRKLISLLNEDQVDFKGDVCQALTVWSELPGPASDAALTLLKELVSQDKSVDPEIVALIVHEKNPAVIPILDGLWIKAPAEWEAQYGDFGSAIEATVIRRFPETKGTTRYSAVRLLGRVGGADSLSVLAAEDENGDSELRVLIEQASKSIRSRMGQ
jgi:predicted Zn finger-like uncharacterized protein